LRAAGEEALAEVERLDQQLSLYQPTSEIARLNADAAHEWVRVTPALFELLQHAQKLSRETGGAFDITVAPLIRCWGFMGGGGHLPQPAAVEEAKAKVGMHLVELDEQNFSVHFARDGVMLDLGAIGKGYAIDRAADRLREAGVTSAILHGGTSTVYAIGTPPETEAWKVAIEYPAENPADQPPVLAMITLNNEALSVSAVWGKSFQSGGATYGHVIDPRSGQPVTGAALAAVALPSATETDALSTALLTLGARGLGQITGLRSGIRNLVVERDEISRGMRIAATGIALEGLATERADVLDQEKER
jgi:thiamine biosynthesis lipoprotein